MSNTKGAKSLLERPLAVLDSLQRGCQVVDHDWRYLYLNDVAIAHARKSRDELIGHTMMECYPGIDGTPLFERLRHSAKTREPSIMENDFTYPDGSSGQFELRIVPVPEGLCILTEDITERVREREALSLEKRRFEQVYQGLPHAALFVGQDGRIELANPRAAALFGYDEGELVGQELEILVPEGVRESHRHFRSAFDRTARVRPMGSRPTFPALRKDGSHFMADIALGPADVAGEPSIIVLVRDASATARLEEQLRQSQKLEALGSLAGGIAHDFNNLLSIIISYSQMLVDEAPEEDPNRFELQEILDASNRAAALTHQLLAFGRRQMLQPKPCNMNHVAKGLHSMLRRLVNEHVSIQLRLDSSLHDVLVDQSQLEQVIVNLAINARDAMPEGGALTIETKNVVLDAEYAESHAGVRPGAHSMIAVSDTGTGMSSEVRQQIFDPFFSTKAPGEGTGLGLATVFGIVEQSGGHIWVYSEPGKGTAFKVYFPHLALREGRPRIPTPTRPEPERLRGNESILLVEDDPGVRALASRVLAEHGYRVVEAKDGTDALRVASLDDNLDLLLTDVVMPGIGGSDIAAQLVEKRPELRVVFMSGYTDGQLSRHGLDPDRTNFLPKPLTPAALLSIVRTALDQPQSASGIPGQ